MPDHLQLAAATRKLHALDVEEGHAAVELPDALAEKYPQAPGQLAWQFIRRARRWIGP